MATYQEVAQLFSESIHENKIRVAIAVSALDVMAEADTVPNHAERFAWAADALSDPSSESQRFLIGVLAANRAATVTQIENATDSAIQTNVDSLVDIFALSDAAT